MCCAAAAIWEIKDGSSSTNHEEDGKTIFSSTYLLLFVPWKPFRDKITKKRTEGTTVAAASLPFRYPFWGWVGIDCVNEQAAKKKRHNKKLIIEYCYHRYHRYKIQWIFLMFHVHPLEKLTQPSSSSSSQPSFVISHLKFIFIFISIQMKSSICWCYLNKHWVFIEMRFCVPFFCAAAFSFYFLFFFYLHYIYNQLFLLLLFLLHRGILSVNKNWEASLSFI